MKRIALVAVLAFGLASVAARADDLVDALSGMAQNRGMMGELSVVKFTGIKKAGNAPHFNYQGTLQVLMPLERGEPAAKPETYNVNFHSGGEPPLNKPVVVLMRVFQQGRAYLSPLPVHHGGARPRGRAQQVYFSDRGEPSGRLFKLTREVLFPDMEKLDRNVFVKRLVELTDDTDPKVADLAASYIGSPINLFARQDCPDEIIDAFAELMLRQTDNEKLGQLTSFFNHAPLPGNGQTVLKLLAVKDAAAAASVTRALSRSADRVERLAPTLKQALASPENPELRTRLLGALRPWGQKARPLWEVVDALTLGREDYRADTTQRGLAAQLLVAVDSQAAAASVHKALADLDDPAVYRFVYEQRMYDVVGVLVDKLRKRTTSHDALVCALIAALVRNPEVGDAQTWVAWWDEMADKGIAMSMVGKRFIPDDKRTTIDRLVQELADTSYTKRTQAMQVLHATGPLANPVLEKALDHRDFEVRVAAEQLLEANHRRMQPVLQKLGARAPRNPNLPEGFENLPPQMQIMLQQKMMR